ncbi:MAG: hypothetical protein U5K33_01180 [Halofilum sp. (in: g-proteobacteria)]|nr:hypothetical protein [Halofilum sp. (in: g-proteobacteria)]
MNTVRFHIDKETPRVCAQMDAGEVELPALWLRERCQDEGQVDTRTQQRLFNPHELPD